MENAGTKEEEMEQNATLSSNQSTATTAVMNATAITQKDVTKVTETDVSPGTGQNVAPGPGKNVVPGSGKNVPPGPGKNVARGPGKNIAPGPGKNVPTGPGRKVAQGAGKNVAPGTGKNVASGPGKNVAAVTEQNAASSEITLKTSLRHLPSGVPSEDSADSHASNEDVSSSLGTGRTGIDNAAFSDTDVESSLAGSSEVTMKTYFRYVPPSVISDTTSGTGSNDDTASSVGISSTDTKSSIETVQPYAVSNTLGLTVDISQSAIDSAYHNPYAHAYAVSKVEEEASAQGSEAPVSPGATSITTHPQSAASAKVSSPGVFTRQLNMFIGEEWEDVQPRWPAIERKALSCPGSLRIPHDPAHPQRMVFKHEQSNRQRLEYLQSRRQQLSHDPLRYFFYNMSHEEPVLQKDYMVKPNPHNKINHMIHSALHCPCFFFFYLLCCLPGVHLMTKGDLEYKTGHEEHARKFGRIATVLYFIGFVLGTTLLGTVVYLAVSFVQGQVG
ncbi:uncharacterized protein [Argopecten irradians]|uniref:uncharacterized protein n=1 Tax=Argopecten irradians TaxID=31199 RepID=UPI0037102C85